MAGTETECGGKEEAQTSTEMEIGWPSEVKHVAHVTFDRFHGFLGLPVEFEPEVPRRAPSASASVFGVSTESMQCSYDSRGNSVPTILLLMQRRLYEQGGLRAEGIFRINGENGQEEYVRDQLNSGIVPDGIDVNCLAALIKAWFRELPTGVLDPLNPEQVIQCQSEEDYNRLLKLLPPTESALLSWAINLMADVVQEEQQNKMNARNVAMVFAPNMSQMADPLTALMYAVQVMNFLKTLILKTLKEREEPAVEEVSVRRSEPSDENDHQSSQLLVQARSEGSTDQIFILEKPVPNSPIHSPEKNSLRDTAASGSKAFEKDSFEDTAADSSEENLHEIPRRTDHLSNGQENAAGGSSTVYSNSRRIRRARSSNGHHKKANRKTSGHTEKSRGGSIVSRINSKVERVEAWR